MNVYQIGVAMTMTNGVSPVLQVIARDIMGIHHGITAATAGLSKFRVALAGAGAIMGGLGIGHAMEHIVQHGGRLQHFETQFRAAGYSAAEVGMAVKEAWHQATTSANADVSTTLMNIQHLTSVTGHLGEALNSIGAFNKMSFALSSLKDDQIRSKYEGDHLQTYNAARALEMLGKTRDPETLNKAVQDMTRTIISFRGLVDGTQYYTAMKNAGGKQAGWTDEFAFKHFPAMIQEMTAGRAANAVYMIQRGFGQGGVTQYAGDAGIKYGLWKPDDKLFANGRFVGMKTDSIIGADELKKNPYKWVGETLIPALKAHGMKTQDQIKHALDELARNKTFSQAIKLLTLDKMRQQIEKEARNVDRVPEDAADVLTKNDYSLAIKGLATQWDNLLTALGRPITEGVITGIQSITSALQGLTSWASSNPDTIKVIGAALAGVAAGLVVLGGALIGGALIAALGTGGWLVAGIAALGTAVAGLYHFFGGKKDSAALDNKEASDKLEHPLRPFDSSALPEEEKSKSAFDIGKSIGEVVAKAALALPGFIVGVDIAIAKIIGSAIMQVPRLIGGFIAGLVPAIASAIGAAISSGVKGIVNGGAKPDHSLPGQHGSIAPPPRQAPRQTASAGDVYLDGDKVGRHVARQIARGSEQVSSPAQFDGSRHMVPADFSFA